MMDFDDSPDEAAFRGEVRAWLEAHAVPQRSREERFGAGLSGEDYLTAAKAWQAGKARAGYAAIAAPRELGGLGGTPAQQVIYNPEESRFVVPGQVFEVSLGTALPTVAMWDTPAQKAKYLASAYSGEHIWCQLFSEPSAGSDLGGLRTRAVREGDAWIVTGQKVWTSMAQHSDYGILLARTD